MADYKQRREKERGVEGGEDTGSRDCDVGLGIYVGPSQIAYRSHRTGLQRAAIDPTFHVSAHAPLFADLCCTIVIAKPDIPRMYPDIIGNDALCGSPNDRWCFGCRRLTHPTVRSHCESSSPMRTRSLGCRECGGITISKEVSVLRDIRVHRNQTT